MLADLLSRLSVTISTAPRSALIAASGATVLALLAADRVMRRSQHATTVVCADTPANTALLAACPSLSEYRPTPWLPGPHLNTLGSSLLRVTPGLAYQRQQLRLPDGGAIALDWLAAPRKGQPVVIIMHGACHGRAAGASPPVVIAPDVTLYVPPTIALRRRPHGR